MKHLLILGGHEETFHMMDGLPFRLSLFQNEESASAFQNSRADHCEIFDYTVIDEALRRARALHASTPLDGVVSFTEFGLLPAARIAAALGLRGNALRAVELTRDKIAMREALRGSDVGTTRFAACHTPNDVTTFFREGRNRPIILKLPHGAGKAGITRIANVDEIPHAWERARKEERGVLLAEEMIDGPEFSVETITRSGFHEVVAITEKMTSGAPHFIELGHQQPAPLEIADQVAIEKTALAFLSLIGQTTGAGHLEVRVGANGVKIIEGNTRAGGGFIWQLVKEGRGVDLIRESLCDLLDLPVTRSAGAGAGCVHLFALEKVRVQSVSGLEEARRTPGVVRLALSLEIGQRLAKIESNDDRQGALVVVGPDLASARKNRDLALSRLEILTIDEP